MMTRIEIYVQFSMTAELATVFSTWSDAEKSVCQQLANRMKSEVRAIQGDTELARFYPHQVKAVRGAN